MAKIRTIKDINMRAKVNSETQVIIIPKDSFIKVTEEMAVYLCNEDIENLSYDERKKHKRIKHAVRTGTFSVDNLTKTHEDYTYL